MHESWCLLKHHHSRFSVPWLCCGDFNEILHSGEKQGGLPKPIQPMQEFFIALLICGLVDWGFQGNIYTWNNGCLGYAFVQERLDRAYASLKWRVLFPHAKVSHIQASYFDHVLVLINITRPNQSGRRKKVPKRFEERWVSLVDCENVSVKHGWVRQALGAKCFGFLKKLKGVS